MSDHDEAARPRYSTIDMTSAIDDFVGGMPVFTAARYHNIPSSTLRDQLRRRGLLKESEPSTDRHMTVIAPAIDDHLGGMTAKETLRRHKISQSTLYRHARRREQQRLSPQQESELAKWILSQHDLGSTPTRAEILKKAGEISNKEPPGRVWLKLFLDRHPEIKAIVRRPKCRALPAIQNTPPGHSYSNTGNLEGLENSGCTQDARQQESYNNKSTGSYTIVDHNPGVQEQRSPRKTEFSPRLRYNSCDLNQQEIQDEDRHLKAFVEILHRFPVMTIELVKNVISDHRTGLHSLLFRWMLCVGSLTIPHSEMINRYADCLTTTDWKTDSYELLAQFHLVQAAFHGFRGEISQALQYCKNVAKDIRYLKISDPDNANLTTIRWGYVLLAKYECH